MKNKRLLRALGEVDDKYIDEAAPTAVVRTRKRMRILERICNVMALRCFSSPFTSVIVLVVRMLLYI